MYKDIGPIFFITPNPNRAIGLEKEIENYHIICSQKSDIIDYLREEGVSVLCLNNNLKNSGKILADEKAIKYIKEKSKDKKANIITFKPSPMIQKVCEKNNFRYTGNDWELNRKIEDKTEFVGITDKLKIPNAKSSIIKIENNKEFKNKFDFRNGKKYVIQLPRGFSGNSTFLIENKKDLEKIIKRYANRAIKLSGYIKGLAYTINACVYKSKTLVSQPILQITGLISFNKNILGTSGNDYEYSKNLSESKKKELIKYARKIGKYMNKLGYKGIFGLDFVVNEKEVNLIEINPRLVASIPIFTKLELENERTPFLFLQIAEFLKREIKIKTKKLPKVFNASHLIIRNTRKNSAKVIKSVKTGIYEIKNNKLTFKEKAYCLNRNLKKNELLIQSAVKGSEINSDMEYASIQVSYGIMRNEKQFSSYFGKIINILLENIKIK